MRKWLLIAATVSLFSLVAVAQGLYPVYYDCTLLPSGFESGTRLFVSNPNDTGVQYTITLFSPQGSQLGTADYFVNQNAAHQIWLADLISGDRMYAWGLCVLQTWLGYPTELEIVAERYTMGTLLGYDAIPADAVGSWHSVFYNASHSQGGPDNDTHLSVMNPTDTANGYQIELYDAYGSLLAIEYGIVNPGRTNVHRLSDFVTTSRDFAWGLCIVRARTYEYERFAVNVYRLRDGRFLNSQTVP